MSVGPLEANAKKERLQEVSLVGVCGGGGRSRGTNAWEGNGERKQVLSLAEFRHWLGVAKQSMVLA